MGGGKAGPIGPKGEPGLVGPQGPIGETTWSSFDDAQKTNLINKLKAYKEFVGPVGPAGPPGPLGPKGDKGADGPAGPQGPVGVGVRGADGPPGVDGQPGRDGPVGADGLRGADGPAGQINVNDPSFRDSMVLRTMWCADGDICKIPSTYIDTAGSVKDIAGIQLSKNWVMRQTGNDISLSTTTSGSINFPLNRNFVSNNIMISGQWQRFPDGANNRSEISNDTNAFKALMIAGNKSGGGARRIQLYDEVEIASRLRVMNRDVLAELTLLNQKTQKLNASGNMSV